MLETALEYLRRGWSVFPLKDKRSPSILWKSFQSRLPTEYEVRSWDWSSGWIGLALGEISGVVRIDADGPFPSEWQLTPTYEFTTPSGGRGWLYKHYPGMRTEVLWSGNGPHEELRVQSNGAYTVLPPSPGYTPIGGEVAEPPTWLLERAAAEVLKEQEKQIRPWVAKPDLGTLQGALDSLSQQRCDEYTSWWQVGAALHNLGHEYLQMWIQWSRKSPKFQDGACEKAWMNYSSDKEKQITWRSIYRWAKEDNPGWKSPTKHEPFTDQGSSRVFARAGMDTLRYCKEWEEWVGWDGRRWERNAWEHAMRLQKKLNIDRYRETSKRFTQLPEDREEAQKRIKLLTRVLGMCRSQESCGRIKAVVTLAKDEPELLVNHSKFNQQPMLLNCPNGTLDLKSFELMPHSIDHYITQMCPTEWWPDAVCPRWIQFLDEVFQENTELIHWIQKYLGYCLTGLTNEHILPIWYGTGRNGKSTMVKAVMHVMGPDYSCTLPSGMLMATTSQMDKSPLTLMQLYGRRFVMDLETSDKGKLSEEVVKRITGGDEMVGRMLYQDFLHWVATHKIGLVTNYPPRVTSADVAMWARIRLIPFLACFEGKEDRMLHETLALEACGILRWMGDGLLMYQSEGLTSIPSAMVIATGGYRSSQDSVAQWFSECVERCEGIKVLKRDVIGAYRIWCRNNSMDEVSPRTFGSAVAKFGVEHDANYYFSVKIR